MNDRRTNPLNHIGILYKIDNILVNYLIAKLPSYNKIETKKHLGICNEMRVLKITFLNIFIIFYINDPHREN